MHQEARLTYIGILSLPQVVGGFTATVVAFVLAASRRTPDEGLKTSSLAAMFGGAASLPLSIAGLIFALALGA